MIRRALLVVLLVVAVATSAVGADYQIGLARVEGEDRDGTVRAYVWYPSKGPAGAVAIGPYSLDAAMNVAPAAGRHPVVLISHGTGGSALNHHDTAAALAREGFIVVAAAHPRDNVQDQSGFGGEPQLVGRPRHLSVAIDALLAHPTLGPVADGERVGVIGYSAGGYTALVIIGGVPDLLSLREYFRLNPNDPARRLGPAPAGPAAVVTGAPHADARVKAAILWAPALGPAFDRAGLARITVPLRIYAAERDELLPSALNASRIASSLPSPPEYVVLPGAGHFVFLAPCPAALRAQVPAFCEDPPGIDRRAVHERLNAEAIEFFRRTLSPLPR